MKRKPIVIAAAVLAVLLVIVATLPFLFDANQFKPTLESNLSSALDRKVQIGSLSFSILSGGVSVDNVTIADDPDFSRSPFLKARQLTVGVALIPLIFSKKLEVRSFTVVEPEVTLLRTPSGNWNFSSLGGESKKSKHGDSPSSINVAVQKLTISNGRIIVGSTGAAGKRQVYENVTLEVFDLSYTSQFPFQLSAKTPGGGTVTVNGKAGPIDRSDASLTPLNAKLDVRRLDLASTGFVAPSSGIAGVIDFNGDLTSDGRQMNSKGTVKADKIKLVPAGSPSRVPVNVDYNTDYDLRRETGVLKQGDVHIGKALARLTGSYNTARATTTVQLKLTGQDMSVPDLQGVLPAVGVTLPSGASLESGALDANLAITGPADKLTITGPVNLSNGKLAGFNLKSKLGALAAFAGLGGGSGSDTEIQTLSASLRVEPEGTHAENLNLVVPAIGTITGDGNISSSGQLNCRMLAKLANPNSPVGGLASAISSFTGGGSSQASAIPFLIQGTTSNPVFVPDVAGVVSSMMKNRATGSSNATNTASGILGGLLGTKKPPQ